MSNVRFPQYGKRKSSLLSQKELSRRMAKSAMDIYLMLAIGILADKFQFGQKRIERFKNYYLDLAESLGTGEDDLETIRANIKEVFGIEV